MPGSEPIKTSLVVKNLKFNYGILQNPPVGQYRNVNLLFTAALAPLSRLLPSPPHKPSGCKSLLAHLRPHIHESETFLSYRRRNTF